jgi:hypothetical protein
MDLPSLLLNGCLALFPEVKLTCHADGKKEWSCTSLPRYAFMAFTGKPLPLLFSIITVITNAAKMLSK